VLSAMLALYYLYQLGGFNGFHKFEIDTKQILTYSLPLTAAAVSQYLTSWTDVLMLGTFTTESAVGRYQAAFQTAMILGFLLSAANSIFPSLASNLYDAGKTHELRDVYSILTKWITYLTVLGYTFVILYTSEILFLFGSEFVAAETVLIILAGVFVISTMVGPAGYLLMMADYEKVELINTLISGTLNIILNFILIQRFGILGAAIATGLSLVFQNLLRLSEIYWYFGIYPEIKNYWKGGIAIVVSVPVMIVCQYFISNYIVLLITSGMMGLITFALVTTLLGIDNKDKILVEKIS